MKYKKLKYLFGIIIFFLSYIISIKIINFIFISLVCLFLLEDKIKKIVSDFKKKQYFSIDFLLCLLILSLFFFHLERQALFFLLIYELNEYILYNFIKKQESIEKTLEKNKFSSYMISQMCHQTEDTKKYKKLEKTYTLFFLIVMFLLVIILLILKINLQVIVLRMIISLLLLTISSFLTFIQFLNFSTLYQYYKKKIYFKKKNVLEKLQNIKTVVFSKTGVLTKPDMELVQIIPVYKTKEDILRLASYIESGSNHPMAKAILNTYTEEIDLNKITNLEDIKGMGRHANVEGEDIYIGNKQLFDQMQISYPKVDFLSPICMIAVDGTYVGTFVFKEEIKESAYLVASLLREQGIEKVGFISSSDIEQTKKIGNRLSMNESYAYLTLKEKQEVLKMYQKEQNTLYIDAFSMDDSLKTSVSLSLLYEGEHADIIIMDEDLHTLIDLKKINYSFLKKRKFLILSFFLLKTSLLILSMVGMIHIEFLIIIELIYTLVICNNLSIR